MAVASLSNTSMNVLPMALRFNSGSDTPFSAPKNKSSASERITFTPIFLANISITMSPSFLRSKPLSTNTHVSWSPMALCKSAATTEESTPPDKPSNTFLSPTCFCTRWIWSSIIFAGVHKPSQPAMSLMKCSSMRPPWSECVTSGWNCTPKKFFSAWYMPAIGQLSVLAINSKPSGIATTLSPWLIQTSNSFSPLSFTWSAMSLNKALLPSAFTWA